MDGTDAPHIFYASGISCLNRLFDNRAPLMSLLSVQGNDTLHDTIALQDLVQVVGVDMGEDTVRSSLLPLNLIFDLFVAYL